MIDPSLSSFVVDIEILKVVVEVDGASTQVATKERGVGGEDSSDIDMTFAAEWDREAGLPLMEMSDNCRCCLTGDIL